MKISNEFPVMIFSNTKDDKTYYQMGLSKRNIDKTYTNGYIQCQFKKGVEIDNQTNIYIKDAWLSFYLKDGKTIPYIFINDFQLVADVIKQESLSSLEIDEIDITDSLPF